VTVALTVGRDWEKAPVNVEKISSLVLDYTLYPRKEVDMALVQVYARALEAGSVFPCVKIGLLAKEKIIVDGVHRIRSREQLKIDYVDCQSLKFESEATLFAEAVRLNSGHGKGFSDVELKANIKRLQKYKFDVQDIQSLVHVPIAEICRETAAPIVTLTAPCGKKFHADSAGKLKPGLNGRELVDLKNSLVLFCNLAESGRFPVNDPVIKALVDRARLDFGRLCFTV